MVPKVPVTQMAALFPDIKCIVQAETKGSGEVSADNDTRWLCASSIKAFSWVPDKNLDTLITSSYKEKRENVASSQGTLPLISKIGAQLLTKEGDKVYWVVNSSLYHRSWHSYLTPVEAVSMLCVVAPFIRESQGSITGRHSPGYGTLGLLYSLYEDLWDLSCLIIGKNDTTGLFGHSLQ